MSDKEITAAVLDEIIKEIPDLKDEENKYVIDQIERLGGAKACYKDVLISTACLVKLLIDVKKSE